MRAKMPMLESTFAPDLLEQMGRACGEAIEQARHQPFGPRGKHLESLIQALPAAIYTTDAAGRITFFNEAAAELWGCRPEIGKSEFCGSWKLYWPDGKPLPHGECPMALALKEQRVVRGLEAVAERPDGTRVHFVPYPTPLFDDSGILIGAVNMLIDISDRKRAEANAQRLASIVETSEDAIISKDLRGIITSWNRGAERVFGYAAEEVIGKPITILIPEDRMNEEPAILDRISRGERVDHYDTVRRRKDRKSDRYFVDGVPAEGCPWKHHWGLQDCQGHNRAQASSGAANVASERDATSHQKLLGNDTGHCNSNPKSTRQGARCLHRSPACVSWCARFVDIQDLAGSATARNCNSGAGTLPRTPTRARQA